jgi:hypothetical protein
VQEEAEFVHNMKKMAQASEISYGAHFSRFSQRVEGKGERLQEYYKHSKVSTTARLLVSLMIFFL